MSKLSGKTRQFRILALPLARIPRSTPPTPAPNAQTALPSTSSSSSSSTPIAGDKPRSPLFLFHVSQPDSPAESGPPPITQRVLQKASDTWLKLGEKDKNSYSYWFYKKGEGLMDKIEYEEWALKAIQEGQGVKIANTEKGEVQEKIEIPLLKPTFQDKPLPPLIPKLHRLLIHRIPYHRKMMYRSLIFSPLTWPFAIIPIIPNFPLFYVLWRAWSHYKAYRGALYLENLLKLGMIVEKPSAELDNVYASKGIVIGEEGAENVAPDSTVSNGIKNSKASLTKGSATVDEVVISEGETLPEQAKGEKSAPDGTATPASMVYGAKGAPAKASAGTNPAPRHPALMLAPNQVPLLAKTFDLRPLEVIDITRAVEQAELRARAVDKQNAAKDEEGKKEGEGGAGKGEGKGTEWRGNLHR